MCKEIEQLQSKQSLKKDEITKAKQILLLLPHTEQSLGQTSPTRPYRQIPVIPAHGREGGNPPPDSREVLVQKGEGTLHSITPIRVKEREIKNDAKSQK